MNPSKTMLYAVSFVSNVITPFRLDPATGKVLARLPLVTRSGYTPANDSKDAVITRDGKHLYWLGSLQSYSVNWYNLGADGRATYAGQYTLNATKAAVGKPGVYDLAGIAQYDLP